MKPARRWQKLDNAAKIFPPTTTARDPKVFRFACELHDPVTAAHLQEATARTLSEFPFFRYTLRHGVFWYYLEDTDNPLPVFEEEEPPCQPLYIDAVSPLFRVLYYRNRISLEVYHVLTDGTGALQFFRTLICRYLQLAHPDALAQADLNLGFDASAFQRAGDSFDKYYQGGHGRQAGDPPAYQIRGLKFPPGRMRVTIGETPVDGLLQQARARGTTATVLIASCILLAIAEEMAVRDRKKRVVATIPVNLRNFFASDTARNFFSLINVGVDFQATPLALDAVIAAFSAEMKRLLTQERMQSRLDALGSLEHNAFLRVLPLAVKDPVLFLAGKIADNAATISFSNVGRVDMPAALAPYLKKFDVFISTGRMQMCSCSYGNVMSLTFTSVFLATDIERRFFRLLTEMDLPVTISTNLEGGDEA